MKAGAADFVTKPWTNAQLLQSVRTALGLAEAGAARPRAAAPPTREELDERCDFGALVGEDPRLLRRARRRRPRGADRRLGAGHRRERDRQGARRRGDPPQQPPPRRALRQGQPRRHRHDAVRERDVRPRARRVHRRPGRPQGPLRAGRTAARSSSTRSARLEPSAPGQAAARAAGPHLRGARLERHAHASTCASSRPRTATWPRWSARGSSARTCSTGST